jgi:hypothetical protein
LLLALVGLVLLEPLVVHQTMATTLLRLAKQQTKAAAAVITNQDQPGK